MLTLWDPRKGKFNVTDKGGTLEAGYLDLRAVAPNLILLVLLSIGFTIGVLGIITTDSDTLEFRAYLLNTVWAGLCLIPLAASVAVGREREQMRNRARVEAVMPGTLTMAGGERLAMRTANLSLSGARIILERPLGVADGDRAVVELETGGETITLNCEILRWSEKEAFIRFLTQGVAEEAMAVRAFFGRPDAWLYWDDWPADRPIRSLANVVMATADAVTRKYRFGLVRPAHDVAVPAAAKPGRVSDVVQPRRRVMEAALLALCLAGTAAAQTAPPVPPPIAAPTAAPAFTGILPEGARVVTRTLRDLGLQGPMQLRGVSDLQGVLFGLRADEVVTEARLTVAGGASAALIPALSQISVSLNEQFVGNIPIDPARQAFGPLEFPLDPLFFAEVNRLNFRFAGRYAVECNDPLSGLLYATVSDLSSVQMRRAAAAFPEHRP